MLLQGIINPLLPDIFRGLEGGNKLFGNTISVVAGVFLIFGSIMALFHLLFGAFRWISASGDKTALQNAQERITQAIVGLIIMAAIWALWILVGQFLGFEFPNLPIPNLTQP